MTTTIQKPDPKRRRVKILIPLIPGSDNASLLNLGHWLAQTEPVLLMGVVPIQEGKNLSTGALPARDMRDLIHANVDRINIRPVERIHVTYNPWEDIYATILKRPNIQLLILNWANHLESLDLTAAEILSHPPCDIALVRGPVPVKPASLLVYNRGGPHAERCLGLSLMIARAHQAKITSLNIPPRRISKLEAEDYAGMEKILTQMPDIEQYQIVSGNQTKTLLEVSHNTDVTILGTAAHPMQKTTSFGRITDTMLKYSLSAVIAVKTKRFIPEKTGSIEFGSKAISVLVDQWFAENTFHADEFADLKDLVNLKEKQGLKISLVLPALNEEETIKNIILISQRALTTKIPLLDEIILMDSDSCDKTRTIANDLGIAVYKHSEVLPQHGSRVGKGEALWKSLYVTKGDLVFWVDTDIKNFHPRFLYGLIGPLLHRPDLKFIKGFYRRPLKSSTGLKPGRGGRVTELTARPLLNLFYPGLSGIIQPLAGEYGGRREALEQMTFMSGYGVESSLLIDAYEKFNLSSIAQVDLVERIHRNQELPDLSKMSFEILQTFISRLEKRHRLEIIEDVNRTMKTVRYESGVFQLKVNEIVEYERPPMIEIPEYREKFGLPPMRKKFS